VPDPWKTACLFHFSSYLPSDEISYNSLLHAISKESDPWWSTQADSILQEMREKNIPMSIITYNVLMTVRGRSMAKDGAARAEELLRNMENEGLTRNEMSYNICIDAYARRGNHVKAESLLSEMLSLYEDEGDLSCRPSIHSFASVVSCHDMRIFNIITQPTCPPAGQCSSKVSGHQCSCSG